jgi:hypothetical protein
VQQRAKKSPLGTAPIQEIMEAMADVSFQHIPIAVRDRSAFIFGLGGTPLCELAVRECKMLNLGDVTKKMRPTRRAAGLVESSLLADFCQDEVLPHDVQTTTGGLPRLFFRAGAFKTPEISGITGRRNWDSFTAQSSAEWYGNNALFDVLRRGQVVEDMPYGWSDAKQTWTLSCMAHVLTPTLAPTPSPLHPKVLTIALNSPWHVPLLLLFAKEGNLSHPGGNGRADSRAHGPLHEPASRQLEDASWLECDTCHTCISSPFSMGGDFCFVLM